MLGKDKMTVYEMQIPLLQVKAETGRRAHLSRGKSDFFFLSWNIMVSPSMVIESFAGYSSLGWHLCSLRVCMTSAQDLLAFIISGEKSVVILIGLPLYVT